jgi:hypothetical protein
MLTKDHALLIAKKLKADVRPKSAHDLAVISHEGKRIAQFGIRRGSNKNQGHNHIPNGVHLTPHDTLLLAECSISADEWIDMMKQKGLIQDSTGTAPRRDR